MKKKYWLDKTVLITGAASGIGRALAAAMIRRGALVYLTDINPGVMKTARELGDRFPGTVLDVTDYRAVEAIIKKIVEKHGRLDCLVNNAGIGFGCDASHLTIDHYNRYIDINIRGVANGVAAAYPLMVKQGAGTIVNISSVGGLIPSPVVSAYGMTKHAVTGLSLSLREEAKHKGVNVITVCPGSVNTPVFDSSCPKDLPPVASSNLREYTREELVSITPERFAEKILPKIEKNSRLIIYPSSFRLLVLIYRYFPKFFLWMTGANVKQELERLNSP